MAHTQQSEDLAPEHSSQDSSVIDSEKTAPDQDISGEREKELESVTPQEESRELVPIRASGQETGPALSRVQSGKSNCLRPVRSQRSYAGGDGYTCFSDGDNLEGDHGVTENTTEKEKEFEVAWDGDADPMNPRNKGNLQRWFIVLIISSSSLCVYV